MYIDLVIRCLSPRKSSFKAIALNNLLLQCFPMIFTFFFGIKGKTAQNMYEEISGSKTTNNVNTFVLKYTMSNPVQWLNG